MDFMFSWQKQYLTSEILCLTREHKSISSRNRLMSCLLYEPKTICIFKTTTMKMAGNFRTSYVTRRSEIRKIRASGPGCSDV